MAPDQARPNTRSAAVRPWRRTLLLSTATQGAASHWLRGVRDSMPAKRRFVFPRHAQRTHAVALSDGEQKRTHGGMEVEVMVRVDVVERQTGRLEGTKLRLDFRRQLPAHARAQEHAHARARDVAAQAPPGVDQVRYALRRQQRRAIDEYQVQADVERRQAARARHRVGCCRSRHHQACRRQDALRVRELDAFVDLHRQAEIVGRDDERLQCAASRRSRRK